MMSHLHGIHDTADQNLRRLLRAIRNADSSSADRSTLPLNKKTPSNGPKPPFVPHPGSVVRDTWVLSERVGQGGFGLVFSAYHRALNRIDAVKFLHPHLSHDPELRARFTQEALVMAKLRGEHLVHVYDCGEHHGLPFFAMEFLRGKPLQEIAIREQPVSLRRFHALANGILRGLAEIHAHGIVHRDVKPANIFVLEQTHFVKVLDFGLAKTSMRLTSKRAIMGTLLYMAPELLLTPDTQASPATDIYSAGVVLYQLLTGHVPYASGRNGNISDFIQSVFSSTPRPPRADRPSIPAPLEDLILHAIDKNPSRRPKSAGGFADALEQAMAAALRFGNSRRRAASTLSIPPSHHKTRKPRSSRNVQALVALPVFPASSRSLVGDRAGRARAARGAHVSVMLDNFSDVPTRAHLDLATMPNDESIEISLHSSLSHAEETRPEPMRQPASNAPRSFRRATLALVVFLDGGAIPGSSGSGEPGAWTLEHMDTMADDPVEAAPASLSTGFSLENAGLPAMSSTPAVDDSSTKCPVDLERLIRRKLGPAWGASYELELLIAPDVIMVQRCGDCGRRSSTVESRLKRIRSAELRQWSRSAPCLIAMKWQ